MIKNIPLILALALICATTAHAEQKMQSHLAISTAVTDYIAQHIKLQGEYEATFLPLDSRLNLPECSEALEVFSTTDVIKAGRITLGVRCNSGQKWSMFTSTIIKLYQSIVVLAQPIQRGAILTREYLALERRDVSNLRDDFITQIEHAENKQVLRQLAMGTVLSPKNLVEPKLVKRKDAVVISSTSAGVSIKMKGIAMMDGTKGQRISVKNQNSGRIINATVIEPGLVSVD